MNNEIINLNENLEIYRKNKIKCDNDIIKYKEHIMFLTDTNQKLLNELYLVTERDQQLKEALNEEDDIPDFINNIRKDIESALNDLDSGLNQNN
jgi:hypothetical protein